MNPMNRRRITKVRPLSVSLNRFSSAVGVAAALAAGVGAAHAAPDFFSTVSSDALWDTPGNWSLGAEPTAADDAIFTQVAPAASGGVNITLTAGELANTLMFRNAGPTTALPYSLNGGDLTLTTGTISVELGASATVNSVLAGAAGLSKTLGGTLILGGVNTYTGSTVISSGVVQISNQAALGASTNTVVVTGLNAIGNVGGQLFLNGATTPVAITRPLSLAGTGLGSFNGALISMGNNTISGGITLSNATATRLFSTLGTTTVTGSVVGGNIVGNVTIFSGNIGNFDLSGATLSGGFLQKEGTSTLILGPANTYTGTTSLTAGFTRVSSQASLGTSTLANAINLAAGTLEVRGDTPNFANKRVTVAANSTIFVDHAIGSTVLNQTANFPDITLQVVNRNITFNGRDGYGISFTPLVAGATLFSIPTAGDNQTTITNNLNAQLTINSNVLGNTGIATSTRAFTIAGNGDTLITGSVLEGATGTGVAVLTKTGVSTLTIGGSASTYGGDTNINVGTVSIASFGALGTGLTADISLGSGTNVAAGLRYTGPGGTTAKTISLVGSTGGAGVLDASGTGAAVFTNNITNIGTGNKTLFLTGSSNANNEISGIIANNTSGTTGTVALTKTGNGTWILSGNNNFGGIGTTAANVTINGGTLQLRATTAASNIIRDTVGVTFTSEATINALAGGRLQYVGAAGGSTEVLERLQATDGNSIIQLDRNSGTTQLLFNSALAPTHGVGNALNYVVNPNGGTNGVDTAISFTGQTNSGFMGFGMFFNGSEFAAYNGSGATGFVRELQYGVDPNAAAVDTLTTGSHAKLTITPAASGSISIPTLNLQGSGVSLPFTAGSAFVIQTTGRGIIKSGGGAPGSISGGASVSTSGVELSIRSDTAADVLSIDMPIIGGGAGGITKSGAGTLILSASNTYAGGVTAIDDGILRLVGAGNLGASTNALRVRQFATLDLGGVPAVSVGQLNGIGSITSTIGGATLFTFGNTTAGSNFSGVISDGAGTISVTKNGTGVAVLSGVNSYSGPTLITNGTVSVASLANGGSNSGIGRSSSAAANLILGGALGTGTGILQYAGASAAILQGTNTPSASTDRLFTLDGNGGTLDSSGGAGNLNNLARTANNAALVFTNTGAVAFASTGAKTLGLAGDSNGDNQINLQLVDNTLGGSLNVNKTGASVWILGNAGNNYTGTTTVSGGVLRAVDFASLPNTSQLTLQGGVLESSGTFLRPVGTGSGAIAFGPGNSGFSANPSNLTVNLGGSGSTLVWATPGFLPNLATGAPSQFVLGSISATAGVEFQNGIDLNLSAATAARTITVIDNPNTSTDFASITGAISGGPSPLTTGDSLIVNGTLQLLGSNSYTGNTVINGNTVVVNSLGNALSSTSSFGAPGGSNVVKAGLTTVAGTVYYVGNGETTNRSFLLTGTTGGLVLDANGSGALIFRGTISDGPGGMTGPKTITLQGTNEDANDFDTSTIALVGGGTDVIGISKVGAGTWVLSASAPPTFNGTVSATAGTLGIGNVAALGAGPLTLGNVNIFAAYGDRNITNPVTLTANTTLGVIGDNNFTVGGPVSYGSNNNNTITNNLTSGKVLTFNGSLTQGDTATLRTLTFNGSGPTVINGDIANTATAGSAVSYTGTGTLTINGAKSFAGGFTENNIAGTVIINDKQSLGTGRFSFTNGTLQATVPLTGANAIPNAVLFGGSSTVSGSNSIEFTGSATNNGGNRQLQNNLPAGTALTLSGPLGLSEGPARTFIVSGTGLTNINGVIANGTAAGSFAKQGTGTVVFGATNTYTGSTLVQAGTLRVASTGVIQSGALFSVSPGATLDVVTGGRALGTVNVAGTVMGGGTIGTLIFTGSTLSPGASPGAPGTLNVTNNLTLNANTHYILDIAGPSNALGTYDRVDVAGGNITLDGDFAGSTPAFGGAAGDIFGIILNNGAGTTTGIINGVADGGLVTIGSQQFNIFYSGNFNAGSPNSSGLLGTGNDVLLVAVPEPSVIGSMVSGMAGLLGLQRFRRRRNA